MFFSWLVLLSCVDFFFFFQWCLPCFLMCKYQNQPLYRESIQKQSFYFGDWLLISEYTELGGQQPQVIMPVIASLPQPQNANDFSGLRWQKEGSKLSLAQNPEVLNAHEFSSTKAKVGSLTFSYSPINCTFWNLPICKAEPKDLSQPFLQLRWQLFDFKNKWHTIMTPD